MWWHRTHTTSSHRPSIDAQTHSYWYFKIINIIQILILHVEESSQSTLTSRQALKLFTIVRFENIQFLAITIQNIFYLLTVEFNFKDFGDFKEQGVNVLLYFYTLKITFLLND